MNYRAKVEDNLDEKGLQRLRVRIIGVHSFDESDIPSTMLPWADPVLPITDGLIDGGHGNLEVPGIGDWVWVFFEEGDTFKSKPQYFGIIRGGKDGNSNYDQGKNKVTADRYGNSSKIDKDQQIYNDSLGNALLKNNIGEFYKDQFNNIVELTEDKILVSTKSGNGIVINEKDNKITITTKTKGSIVIKDDSEIDIVMDKAGINIDANGEILITTKDGKNEQINFSKFLALYNSHTHQLGPLPTTPPLVPLNSFLHAYDAYSFLGGLPTNDRIVLATDKDYVAEDDIVGSVYTDEASIHPDTLTPDENSVASTKLINDSTNPSSDESFRAMNLQTKAPQYTGKVLTKTTFYSRGKPIGNGNLVRIQGNVVEENIGKILYEMIKQSQIDNMVDRLELLELDGNKYIVTGFGEKELIKADGDYYETGDIFPMTEEYQNNECTYSLVMINSGFRSNTENIIDPDTNQVLAHSQLHLRKKNKRRKMTDAELLTLSSTNFSPYTATPGYSKHQNGTAVDFNTRGAGQWEWLVENREKYDFGRTVKSERWHFEYGHGKDGI